MPLPYGVSSDTIYAFLQRKVPEVFDHWRALGALYASHQGSNRFLEEPSAAQHLKAIDAAIASAFSSSEAFDELRFPSEFLVWLDEVKRAGNYLMVRSTGAEDSRQMANAGVM